MSCEHLESMEIESSKENRDSAFQEGVENSSLDVILIPDEEAEAMARNIYNNIINTRKPLRFSRIGE